MGLDDATEALLRLYPRIYFACHTRHVRDAKTGAELSAHQASLLDHLDALAPTLVKDLAAHMGVTPSTISIALDRLEAGGFVKRKRDATDARKVGVLLTAAGVRVRDAKSVLDADLVRGMLKTLPPGELARAVEGLRLLADAATRFGRKAGSTG